MRQHIAPADGGHFDVALPCKQFVIDAYDSGAGLQTFPKAALDDGTLTLQFIGGTQYGACVPIAYGTHFLNATATDKRNKSTSSHSTFSVTGNPALSLILNNFNDTSHLHFSMSDLRAAIQAIEAVGADGLSEVDLKTAISTLFEIAIDRNSVPSRFTEEQTHTVAWKALLSLTKARPDLATMRPQPLTIFLPFSDIQDFLMSEKAHCCLNDGENCNGYTVPGLQTGVTKIPLGNTLNIPFPPSIPGDAADVVDVDGVHIDVDEVCLRIDQNPASTFVAFDPGSGSVKFRISGNGVGITKGGTSGALCPNVTCTRSSECPLYTGAYNFELELVPVVSNGRFKLEKKVDIHFKNDHIAPPCFPNDLAETIVGAFQDFFKNLAEDLVIGKLDKLDHTLINYAPFLAEFEPKSRTEGGQQVEYREHEAWLRYVGVPGLDVFQGRLGSTYCNAETIRVTSLDSVTEVTSTSSSFPRPDPQLQLEGTYIRYSLTARKNLVLPANAALAGFIVPSDAALADLFVNGVPPGSRGLCPGDCFYACEGTEAFDAYNAPRIIYGGTGDPNVLKPIGSVPFCRIPYGVTVTERDKVQKPDGCSQTHN